MPVLTSGEAGPDRFHDKQNVPEHILDNLTCIVISSNGGYVIVNITMICYYAHLRLNRKLRQQLEKKNCRGVVTGSDLIIVGTGPIFLLAAQFVQKTTRNFVYFL